MSSMDMWKLSSRFTVKQAALLILGLDPTEYDDIDRLRVEEQPEGYHAISTAIKNGIQEGSLKVEIIWMPKQVDYDESFTPVYDGETENWDKTLIPAGVIGKWLSEKNYKDNFFTEERADEIVDDFLNPANPFYAPKLAASVHALRAVTSDPVFLSGKTPKQAIEKYLYDNAERFGLLKDDGTISERAVKEICKVANWNPAGGVPKTMPQVSKNLANSLN